MATTTVEAAQAAYLALLATQYREQAACQAKILDGDTNGCWAHASAADEAYKAQPAALQAWGKALAEVAS